MHTVFCNDTRGTICDSCNYLVDDFAIVPWGDSTAEVCEDCFIGV